jgi:predicted phosphodiesterase
MRKCVLTAILLSILSGGPACNRGNRTAPADLARIAGWRGLAANAPDAFRFIVLSDRTGGHEEGAWEKALLEVNRLKPDFVMCVGDLIEGYCDEQEAIEQREEFDALTRRLEAPFFYCPGNHDAESVPTRKVYAARHGTGGRTYYSFDYRSCHFVVLDSSALLAQVPDVTEAQWAWLEQDLASARSAKHVFIFEHHPLYDTPAWERLRKWLDPDRTTVFAGHWHNLSYDREDGVPYFVLGPTATYTWQGPREDGNFKMYAHVAVSGGAPTVSIIPVGQVLPHDFVSRAGKAASSPALVAR